jgi:hypothetical protein
MSNGRYSTLKAEQQGSTLRVLPLESAGYRDGSVSKVSTLRRLNEPCADILRGQRQPASTAEQLPTQLDAPEYAVRLGPQSGDAGDVGRGHARSV